jgi:hypothetical protein
MKYKASKDHIARTKVITLDEYLKEQEAKLERFKQYWLHGHETQPDIFAMEDKLKEWDEQFGFFEDEIDA